MAAKPMILRQLEKLPVDDLDEIDRFVGELRRFQKKRRSVAKMVSGLTVGTGVRHELRAAVALPLSQTGRDSL
jgi:hypothetical protein